jgi:hypothetical protein
MTITLEDVSYRVLPRVHAGRALADSEWRTLMRMAETLLEECPVEISPWQVADNVERFLIAGRSRRAWRVRVLLTLLEFLPVPFYGAPFSKLDRRDRRTLVDERLIGGRHLWSICAKVKLLVTVGIYGDRKAHPAIGFVPIRIRPRHRPAAQDAVAKQPAALEAVS